MATLPTTGDNPPLAAVDRPRVEGRLAFGPFTFDCGTGELREGGRLVRLRPLATRALVLLLERRGELVTREELRQWLWGTSAVEWEAGLHQIVRTLRECLRDDSTRPVYIETIPRRGYRFKARTQLANIEREPRSRSRRSWCQAGFFVGGVFTTLASLTLITCLACLLFAD